jgi:hypothetical protein
MRRLYKLFNLYITEDDSSIMKKIIINTYISCRLDYFHLVFCIFNFNSFFKSIFYLHQIAFSSFLMNVTLKHCLFGAIFSSFSFYVGYDRKQCFKYGDKKAQILNSINFIFILTFYH